MTADAGSGTPLTGLLITVGGDGGIGGDFSQTVRKGSDENYEISNSITR